MVGIFKANNPFNTFLLFIYGLLLKLVFFLHPYKPSVQLTDGPLYKSFLSVLKFAGDSFPFIYPAIAYFFLFTQAAMFNRLVNDKRMIQRSSYLPGMSYMLITSLFNEWSYLSAPLIINTFLIWIWAKITNLSIAAQPKSMLFNIGFVIGISSFIYFPALAFSLLIIFGLIITRPFKPTEWIVAFIGIITPYYFLFAYLFLTDKLQRIKIPKLVFVYPPFIKNYWTAAAIFLVLISFFTGCYFIQTNFKRQLVLPRKCWGVLFFYLGIAFVLAFINYTNSLQIWVLTAIPLSAVMAGAFFYPDKRLFPLELHWLMVGVAVVTSYFIA